MNNVLTEIVNLLTDNTVSVSTSLLKIKVLASRLNNKSLLAWIENELTGYQKKIDLPEYRKYSCRVVGSFIYGNIKYTNQELAINDLPNSIRKRLETIEFYDGISTLESYLQKKDKEVK